MSTEQRQPAPPRKPGKPFYFNTSEHLLRIGRERAGSLAADAQQVFGRIEVEGFSGLARRRGLPLLRAHESYLKFALASNSPVWHASSQRNKNSSNAAGGLSHTWAAVFRRCSRTITVNPRFWRPWKASSSVASSPR